VAWSPPQLPATFLHDVRVATSIEWAPSSAGGQSGPGRSGPCVPKVARAAEVAVTATLGGRAALSALAAAPAAPDAPGAPDAPRFELTAWSPSQVAVLEALQAMWREHLGIEVTIAIREINTLVETKAVQYYPGAPRVYDGACLNVLVSKQLRCVGPSI
jgi:hypothetical protein